jgi:hypothetical protein
MDPHLNLLFVHVPKAGGTSICAAIREHFSPACVLDDYQDRPIDPLSPMNSDPDEFLADCRQRQSSILADKKAVVGHLWPAKYQSAVVDVRATVLREPITRAISHYHFWQTQPPNGHSLHEYVTSRRLSFMEFAKLPMINGLYTGAFFRDVDMGQFTVIGAFETLSSDWSRIASSMGLLPPPPLRCVNPTADLVADYAVKRAEILGNNRVMAQLRDLFANDIRFYERHAIGATRHPSALRAESSR